MSKVQPTEASAAPAASLNKSQQLLTDEKALKTSLAVLRLAAFADCFTSQILAPNFAIMCTKDMHEDSFPNTNPFDFNGAQYFMPMCAGLASAISAIAFGPLSDKFGRRPCILVCLYVGTIGSILKWYAGAVMQSFWGFCIANFFTGLFSSSVTVAMAYIGDVIPHDKEKKEAELGIIIAILMFSVSGGGICAILMDKQGLFMPLWLGIAISLAAGILNQLYLIEPDKDLHHNNPAAQAANGDGAPATGGAAATFDPVATPASAPKDKGEAADGDDAPKTLDKALFWNICAGCVVDNIGSSGMNLCMSPLMFETFTLDPMEDGLTFSFNPMTNATSFDLGEPIMSINSYKWVTVFVALMVIPGAILSSPLYQKVGYAGGCVAGNACTAVHCLLLLWIGNMSASNRTYGIFVAVLYAGFPATVLSQLSTGPMLDAIAPVDQRGYVQGMNNFMADGASAVSPWVIGQIVDKTSNATGVWLCVAFSILACFVNAPLMRHKIFAPREPKEEDHGTLLGEDKDIVARAQRGEWVPPGELDRINEDRMNRGEHFLRIHYGKYADDVKNLPMLRRRARLDFQYSKNAVTEYIGMMQDEEVRKKLVGQVNVSKASAAEVEESAAELGKWFTDYLTDNGYWVEDSPALMKQMIMRAFPKIQDGREVTPDSILPTFLGYLKLMNRYSQEDDGQAPLTKLLASAAVVRDTKDKKKFS